MSKMHVQRLHRGTPAAQAGSVLVIGNFDGVHRGHAALLNAAAAKASALNAPLAVLSFAPHPRVFFQPELKPHTIYPLNERLRLLADAGVEQVFLQRFDAAFSQQSAEDFVQEVLLKQLQVVHVLTGENFIFGHKRRGHEALLRSMLDAAGVGYTAVPASMLDGAPISSTRIRDALHEGAMERAAELLGRPYRIRGTVRHGNRIGRLLGFPTANIQLSPRLSPRYGIYAMWARQCNEPGAPWQPAVASYGTRPTFDNGAPLLEVHLLDAPDLPDLYGQRLEVQWGHFLRSEQKFETPEALMQQMNHDREAALAWLHGQAAPAV
jgi:riboflavin kinase/FMN adenylyltransferase